MATACYRAVVLQYRVFLLLLVYRHLLRLLPTATLPRFSYHRASPRTYTALRLLTTGLWNTAALVSYSSTKQDRIGRCFLPALVLTSAAEPYRAAFCRSGYLLRVPADRQLQLVDRPTPQMPATG